MPRKNQDVPINSLAAIAQELSSLDHALLLSLIAKQHCLIEAERETLDDVAQEIQLIATQLFGLSWATVDCSSDTTLEEFNRSILLAGEDQTNCNVPITRLVAGNQRQALAYSIPNPQSGIEYTIANIVIAKDLGSASRQVQIQTLELIRTNRIFTHTAVHATPKTFLFVVLAPIDAEPLNVHLNDILFLSHLHEPLDELPRLEATSARRNNPVSRRRSHATDVEKEPMIPATTLLHLYTLLPSIDLTAGVRSYLMTIVICIRTHRALMPGSATSIATQYLELLSRCLALLHGVQFISPSMVALAARKAYRHRLRILKPSDAAWERSVMYGSKVAAVKELLENLWSSEDARIKSASEVADGIIEDIIAGTEVPV